MNPTGGSPRAMIRRPCEPPLVTRYFHEVTFAENFEYCAWAFGCFFFKSTPFSSGFLFARLFLCRCSNKEKAFFQRGTNNKNSPGSSSSEPGLPSITRMDIDCCNSLHPGMTPANGGNQLHHMQNVRHGCHLASK